MTDNAALIKKAFDQPSWYLNATSFNIKLRKETVEEFIEDANIGSILDIGCGDGSLSLHLVNDYNHVTFLDQSQTMLEIVRSRVPEAFAAHARTINANFMDAKLEPHSYDLILCVGVLAYIEKRREFVAKVKGALKPGGSVITECTDGAHPRSRVAIARQTIKSRIRKSQMCTIWRPSAELEEMYQSMGFDLQGSFRYSLYPPMMGKLLSQQASYKAVRATYGTSRHNRNRWLGNECLYYFKGPGA